MNNENKDKIVNWVLTSCLIGIILFGILWIIAPSHAQTTSNFQRIRQDDSIIVWKFQDGIADCYVASTIYLNNTSSSSPSISCVKR